MNPGLTHALRLGAFRSLEALSHLRDQPPPVQVRRGASADGVNGAAERPLWVYVTTIGELNAIETWLRALLERLGHPPLTLLTNHPHYADAYLRKFPQATVVAFGGDTAQARALVRTGRPFMLVIAEIPCLLHDAPCRFSYATVHAVRRTGAPVVLVNGWLYGDRPPSRMDRIENRLFARDYVRVLDLALVQTDEVRERMVRAGGRADRIVVAGNLKYDAMRAMARRRPDGALARALLAYTDGPIVVAGSVTETEDQRGLLVAFGELLQAQPRARLVLAPRHPENVARMQALGALLQACGLTYQYRSRIEPAAAMAAPVLVLDTMGELGDCYAAATFAYVGTDHNVLEPLAHGKPVYVSGDWKPVYPSYPVYRQTVAQGLVEHVDRLDELGQAWRAAAQDMGDVVTTQRARVESLMASDTGRVDSSLRLVFEHVGNRVGAR